MTQDEVDKHCESVPANTQRLIDRKLKFGVGLNDLSHITRLNDTEGKSRRHSGYNQWSSLLSRCYNSKELARNPSYKNVVVCKEWLSASKFIVWQKTQYREVGWNLDKDLLVVGNKIYSPEVCIYVPAWLNCFITDSKAARGGCLVGVCWNKRLAKYGSYCNNLFKGKRDFLGYFHSEFEAHLAWRKCKLNIALSLKTKMDIIDLRIYPNVITIIENTR